MVLCFELTMPRHTEKDSKWEGKTRRRIKMLPAFSDKDKEWYAKLADKDWYYAFSDDRLVHIHTRIINKKEADYLRYYNNKFTEYDWMLDSILATGEILEKYNC